MLYYKDNEFHNQLYKAKIIVNDCELISFIHDKEWYEEIKRKVQNIDKGEIEYEDIVLTEEQQDRLVEINNYGKLDGCCISYVIDYVLEGTFPEIDDHPLRLFQLEKENRELKQQLIHFINMNK